MSLFTMVIFVRTSYGKYQSMLISIIIRFGNGGKEYITCKRWAFDAVMSKWNEEQREREWGIGLSFSKKIYRCKRLKNKRKKKWRTGEEEGEVGVSKQNNIVLLMKKNYRCQVLLELYEVTGLIAALVLTYIKSS